MNFVKAFLVVVVVGLVGGVFVIYSGIVNPGSDAPSTTLEVIQPLLRRAITTRASAIAVPPLENPAMVAAGATDYQQFCVGCHLAPGVLDSEIRRGLAPQPANLSQPTTSTPSEMYWIVKHGIALSAMPAWGATREEGEIWNLVAFVKKLPALTPGEYQRLTAPPNSSPKHTADLDQPEKPIPPSPLIRLDGMKPKAVGAAEDVAASFDAALSKGDRKAAIALLAPDATLGSNDVAQSVDDYLHNPLDGDPAGKEARFITRVSMPLPQTAVVGSESEITDGSDTQRFRELLTLKHVHDQWIVTEVRWQTVAEDSR